VDILIPFLVAFGPFALTLMGAVMAIRAPNKTGKEHWFWLVAFLFVGLPISIATYKEVRSSDSVQSEIHQKLGAIEKFMVEQKPSALPGPRQLSDSDAEKLISSLTPLVSTETKVTVSCLLGDVEGCRYAQQWLTILRAAKWNVEGLDQVVLTTPVIGVDITVNDAETPAAGILQHAFSTVGTPARGQIDLALHKNQINLLIGGRP
jgi:hypothetical protein